MNVVITCSGCDTPKPGYCHICGRPTATSRRGEPIVLCIRHPDYSNEFVTDPGVGDPRIVDVDLGAHDLSDPDELAEWLECRSVAYDTLPPGHCKRRLGELLDVLKATHGNIMADGVS